MSGSRGEVFEILDGLVNCVSVKQLLVHYKRLNTCLSLEDAISQFSYFSRLRKFFSKSLQKYDKISSILHKLDKRAHEKCYSGRPLLGQRVLVIGGGISGLRVSIELLLLGANVTCVEKRDSFSRNNVIHLWPNVISDLKALGAKRFYGRFCVGSIDHVAIRQIQLILLKIALIFGLRFEPNVAFDRLCPKLATPTPTCHAPHGHRCHCCCHEHAFGDGANCHFLSSLSGERIPELESQSFDQIIGSDGRRNTLFQDFPRKEFRGKLAIAITANFVNKRTEREARVAEISGVSYIYAQKWFRALQDETGIQLENICYYRDETHYFVMTATKHSLLSRGVLRRDCAETHVLLAEDNIDRQELLRYARDAAQWTSGLEGLEFAENALNSADVALFDFTSVYASRNASRAKRVHQHCCDGKEGVSKYVLMQLTGDSLLEPFWPTGSGAGRGFLSALDAAHTAMQWATRVVPNNYQLEDMYDVIAERESVYRLLAQTTPENVNAKCFSLAPNNRYSNWSHASVHEIKAQIKHLIGWQSSANHETANQVLAAKRARRATVAVTTRDIQRAEEHVTRNEVEFDHVIEEEEEKRKNLLKTEEKDPKREWLLGSEEKAGRGKGAGLERKKLSLLQTMGGVGGGGGGVGRKGVRKEAIIERAQQLEEVLAEKRRFEGKLAKVGKIEENDWNVRVWTQKPKMAEIRKPEVSGHVLANSRAILKSRKSQIESKLNDNPKSDDVIIRNVSRDPQKQWIQRLSEELTQRMKSGKEGEKEGKEGKREIEGEKGEEIASNTDNNIENSVAEEAPPTQSSMPSCVRCGQEVSAVERISVSGDVLHRSCLRCSKCGISLRLNEFRNELKFLCVYCLASNNANNTQTSEERERRRAREKALFLGKIEKIDFRERIEFENKSNNDLNIISKTPLNARQQSPSESEELAFGDNSSECDINSTTSDDSDDWETTSDDDNDDNRQKTTEEETTPAIPSICVTRETSDDNNRNNNASTTPAAVEDNRRQVESVRYLGAFTEKLFRSRSQPTLAFRRGLQTRAVVNLTLDRSHVSDDTDDSDDSLLPFADMSAASQHFSPVRALRAPIIEFKDI